MKIRLMTIDDYAPVRLLWGETAGMGLRSLDDSEAGIHRFLERNPHTCFVAVESGQVNGVILSGHDGRRGYIYHTAVRSTCRKQGIGRALVNAVIEAMQREEIHKIALVAFQSNLTGNQFWESMGFAARTDLVYRDRSLCRENL